MRASLVPCVYESNYSVVQTNPIEGLYPISAKQR